MNEKCPINSIKIVPKSFKDAKYKTIEFTDEFNIAFSKEQDSLPLTQFRLSESTPCLNLNQVSFKKDYKIYQKNLIIFDHLH